MTLDAKLEALLFWKGEPMTKKKIRTTLSCAEADLDAAIAALGASLATRGLRVMAIGQGDAAELELRTAPELGEMIEKLAKDELVRDLGKAGLETLSIILYKGPIKRAEIDYIRGVNSSFILRNLLIRGLIVRVTEKDPANGQSGQGRGFSYKPTIDLLAHLGVARLEDLPDYAKVKEELEAFARAEEAAETEHGDPVRTEQTPNDAA